MADRMHPYSMFPQNLTPNNLQQSQIAQQPPQSSQPDPQMISALSNPERARMWQQMNQLQNSYRSQQSGDLAASQMNHQMQQEFARGQTLSHGPSQPIIQQIQQSFGLNAQRMNPSGPVFHDPQVNQPQSLIPPNFPNVPMNTQQQMKTAFNMTPMMHPAMTNPGVPRQLQIQEMTRLQQSGVGAQHVSNQPPAADMFASSMLPSQDQMHGSPHPAAQPVGPPGVNQGMVPGNPQQAVQKRIMTPAEFAERRNYLLAIISQSETTLGTVMQAARNSNPGDPHIQQKLNQLRTELAGRREMYTKFVATYGAMVTQQMANGMAPSNMAHMSPMTHSTSQQPQSSAASNAQGQPSFVAANERVAAPYKFPPGSGPSPMPAQIQGSLNQQLPAQSTPIGRPNTIPPRTGGTPHQVTGPHMSPNLGNFPVQGAQKVPDQTRQPVAIMPLDKQRFDSTYAQFCRSQNININIGSSSRVPIGDNRAVDLHQLHVQVMHEGGATSVTQRDMWAVIGGRLGFIQFPGNDADPGRCGPVIAHQLQSTYEQYLQHFESAYILTVKNRTTTGSPQQQIHQMNPGPPMGNNATPALSANLPEVPANPPRQLPNSQLIAIALRYAPVPAQDMRAQRVPDHIITFVERHRTELARIYQQQVQVLAQRKAEQEHQNITNGQASLHEQGLLPVVQRPAQAIGANPMVNMAGDTKMQMPNGSLHPENAVATLQRQLPPTQEQVQQASMSINNIKQVFQQRSVPAITPLPVPEDQRQEFGQLLEQVHKMSVELDARLPLYLAFFKSEELLRKYVAIVLTVAKQRQLLSSSPTQYIISLSTLQSMQTQIRRLNVEFENRWHVMRASAAAAPASSQHPAPPSAVPARLNPTPSISVPPMQNISHIAPPAPQINGRSASVTPRQPTPSQSQLQPLPLSLSHSQSSQNQIQPPPQHQSLPLPAKKNLLPPSPSAPHTANLTSPTPPVATTATSTPATSAPTPQPTTSSPQTPKSPPTKVVAKTKAPTRVNRKMSTASRGPATPEMAASSVAGVKRPPEEDIVATLTSVAPSEAEASSAPSPKKVKMEWEGEPSEALIKRQQEIEEIKSDEDAAAFLDHMKELLAMSATAHNDIHHDIHHDLASTLDQILAGVAQEPADAAATAAALSGHGAGDAGPPPTALSPHMGPINDAFSEFIDFSSFTTLDDEDNDSKAPTPDLVPSSETNLSPESGSEGDSLGSTGSPDKIKIEESPDPLRLGSLREIDGGESAYYQDGDWKWEGPMPTLDQPWAIYTS